MFADTARVTNVRIIIIIMTRQRYVWTCMEHMGKRSKNNLKTSKNEKNKETKTHFKI